MACTLAYILISSIGSIPDQRSFLHLPFLLVKFSSLTTKYRFRKKKGEENLLFSSVGHSDDGGMDDGHGLMDGCRQGSSIDLLRQR